jgi:hypothetical protein
VSFLTSSATASLAGISSSMVWVPGRISTESGFASNAEVNAETLATTPAS